MEIKYEYANGVMRLKFIGELDEHYSKGVREYVDGLLNSVSIKKAVFDLSKLTFMDSTGVGILLGRYKRLKRLGVSAYIAEPSVQVDRVLSLSGIYDVMPKM